MPSEGRFHKYLSTVKTFIHAPLDFPTHLPQLLILSVFNNKYRIQNLAVSEVLDA